MSHDKDDSKDDKNRAVARSLVRDLADLLNDTDLTEIEVEQNGLRIRVARQIRAWPQRPSR